MVVLTCAAPLLTTQRPECTPEVCVRFVVERVEGIGEALRTQRLLAETQVKARHAVPCAAEVSHESAQLLYVVSGHVST